MVWRPFVFHWQDVISGVEIQEKYFIRYTKFLSSSNCKHDTDTGHVHVDGITLWRCTLRGDNLQIVCASLSTSCCEECVCVTQLRGGEILSHQDLRFLCLHGRGDGIIEGHEPALQVLEVVFLAVSFTWVRYSMVAALMCSIWVGAPFCRAWWANNHMTDPDFSYSAQASTQDCTMLYNIRAHTDLLPTRESVQEWRTSWWRAENGREGEGQIKHVRSNNLTFNVSHNQKYFQSTKHSNSNFRVQKASCFLCIWSIFQIVTHFFPSTEVKK